MTTQAPTPAKTEAAIRETVQSALAELPAEASVSDVITALGANVFETLAFDWDVANGDVDAFWLIRYEATCSGLASGADHATAATTLTGLVIEWLEGNGIQINRA